MLEVEEKGFQMYLLSYSSKYGREDSFDNLYAQLRENGCHSPTRDSIRKVYRALKTLAMINKLHGKGVNERIPMLELLKQLNGNHAELDLTGCGWEFNGWYTEILSFDLAQLILVSNRSFLVSRTLHQKFFQSDVGEEQLIDELEYAFYNTRTYQKIRSTIIERINRFGLNHLLLEAMYVERHNER
jgi:hypothetical protein